MISYWKLLLFVTYLLIALAIFSAVLFAAVVSFVYGLWIVGIIAVIVFVNMYVGIIYLMIRFPYGRGL